MQDLKIDKEYWNYYNYKIDLNDVFEETKKEYDVEINKVNNRSVVLDDMNQNIDEKNNNTGIEKKKRIHRSGRKRHKRECDDSYKARSVEPNENDNDNVTTSVNNLDTNDSSTDVEDDLMVNSKQKGKMQQELDKKLKLWNDFAKKNGKNQVSKQKHQDQPDKKRRKKSSNKTTTTTTTAVNGYSFKNKDKLDKFRKRNINLDERNKNIINENKDKENKSNRKDDKYDKMNEIRKEHHQNRLNGKQFKISKKKNQQSNQRNQRSNEQHKQRYKKKEKGKQNEKKEQNQKQQQKNQKQQQHQKPKSNMNNNMEQSLTERKSYENDSKKIDDEINQLQGMQYNYLNNGLNNNNGTKIYTYQNPTFYGYKPKNGNHLNRSHMLSKPGSFVPGYMANDVNDFARRIPYDHGGNNTNGNDDWNGRNVGDRRNYQTGNKFYDDYNQEMDYSRYQDQ